MLPPFGLSNGPEDVLRFNARREARRRALDEVEARYLDTRLVERRKDGMTCRRPISIVGSGVRGRDVKLSRACTITAARKVAPVGLVAARKFVGLNTNAAKKCVRIAVSTGKPCRHPAMRGSDFCLSHGGAAAAKRIRPYVRTQPGQQAELRRALEKAEE